MEEILVIGAGPVGLSTAIGFAHVGYNVCCYDINDTRINSLSKGVAPFYEKDLQHYLELYADRLHFTNNATEAFKNSNIFFICVGTPLGRNNGVDMESFKSAINDIIHNLCRESIIVIKSTVPIGTNKRLVTYIDSLHLKFHVNVVSNPEFLSQGSSIQDTISASRIVIGCNDNSSRKIMLHLYEAFDGEKLITTPVSAELIKYEANCYLAMRVSFVNDLACVCDMVGADLNAVIKGVSLDSRIGTQYFAPGLGYGGSCFPKDTVCFHNQIQSEFGYELELIEATIDVNQRHAMRLCRKIMKNYGSIVNKKICVLGLSFKKNTDDVRNSLAVNVVSFLISQGAIVSVWDPVAIYNAKEIFDKQVKYCSSIRDAINSSDIIFIATDWDEIVNIKLDIYKGKDVYDGRNCYLSQINKIDFNYYYIGGSYCAH